MSSLGDWLGWSKLSQYQLNMHKPYFQFWYLILVPGICLGGVFLFQFPLLGHGGSGNFLSSSLHPLPCRASLNYGLRYPAHSNGAFSSPASWLLAVTAAILWCYSTSALISAFLISVTCLPLVSLPSKAAARGLAFSLFPLPSCFFLLSLIICKRGYARYFFHWYTLPSWEMFSRIILDTWGCLIYR